MLFTCDLQVPSSHLMYKINTLTWATHPPPHPPSFSWFWSLPNRIINWIWWRVDLLSLISWGDQSQSPKSPMSNISCFINQNSVQFLKGLWQIINSEFGVKMKDDGLHLLIRRHQCEIKVFSSEDIGSYAHKRPLNWAQTFRSILEFNISDGDRWWQRKKWMMISGKNKKVKEDWESSTEVPTSCPQLIC